MDENLQRLVFENWRYFYGHNPRRFTEYLRLENHHRMFMAKRYVDMIGEYGRRRK